MRAARTEIRQARRDIAGIVGPARFFNLRHPRFDPIGAAAFFAQNGTQLCGNFNWIKGVACRE